MKKGFTLIELLVVVLIIGILSAVALPQYSKAVEKTKTTEALTIINSLSKAIDLYVLENGMEDVSFVGDCYTATPMDLSIDVQESLNCAPGVECEYKGFEYCAYCYTSATSGACGIRVNRKDSKYAYELSMYKSSTGEWHDKACWMFTSDGYEICKLLEPLGWIPS